MENFTTITIMRRIYDSDIDKDGNEKPNEVLGEFLMTEDWLDEFNSGYDFETFGIMNKELYQIVGKEVSGYYNPNMGGIKINIRKIDEENELVKALKVFNSLKLYERENYN
jgi:hypothetical protein